MTFLKVFYDAYALVLTKSLKMQSSKFNAIIDSNISISMQHYMLVFKDMVGNSKSFWITKKFWNHCKFDSSKASRYGLGFSPIAINILIVWHPAVCQLNISHALCHEKSASSHKNSKNSIFLKSIFNLMNPENWGS